MASTPHSHYNFMKRPFKHPLSPTKNRCLWGIFMSCALLSQGTRVCHPIGVLPLCEGAAVSLTPVIRKHLLCTNRMPENWQTDQRLPPQMSLSKQCELRQYTWKSYTQRAEQGLHLQRSLWGSQRASSLQLTQFLHLHMRMTFAALQLLKQTEAAFPSTMAAQ